ncbi:MAG: glycosyltransferase family 4 protein [Candidatus Zambryskibacteria bacterium]|nr:glycosyltransferase family 4 protein [Candidatus Zambryskibacteria bacterium]
MATNNAKKRILIFSTAYHPFVGGAEVSIKEITDRLAGLPAQAGDFEFDLITAKLQKDLLSVEKIGKITVYRLGIGKTLWDKVFLPFQGVFKVWKLQKTRNYFCFWTVMVSFAGGAGYICNILRKLTGKKKIPMVLTLQEGDSESHLNYRRAGLIDLSWRMALWQTDILTGLSNFLLQRAYKKGYKGKSVLVPNGVDLSVFTKEVGQEVKEKIKSQLNKKEGDIFLVTTGRLVHKNANDDVISALVNLPKNVHFIIIGKGDLGPKLQKQANDLGLSDRVKSLGLIPNADLPKYFSVCDIFIRPSRSEGFGISFIEAMAAGLPVIATPVGGIVDFIDDKETGIFCSPDNPRSIADAVTLLLNESNLREHIREKAKARVVERYSWSYIAHQMKEIFDKLLTD